MTIINLYRHMYLNSKNNVKRFKRMSEKYKIRVNLKVILYSYLILKKINERITDVNISTNIHNKRIKIYPFLHF